MEPSIDQGNLGAYVCPRCKYNLEGMQCPRCGLKIDWNHGIPVFFTDSAIATRYRDIGLFYDNLYKTRKDVWKDHAGRGPEFINYMASLIENFRPRRYLEVGCGQGVLLNAVSAPEKYGLEISRRAIETAIKRTTANICQGCIEESPFPSGYFDLVTGIGVMEHFLDDVMAMKEIYRVLHTGGHCILLCFMEIPFGERIMIKVSEFLYPRFRPVRLSRWVLDKCSAWKSEHDDEGISHRQVIQPVQNYYTPRSARRLFRHTGFKVTRLITKRREPSVPLPQRYFWIYILEKTSN
jgi:SAM-dependent methyltransferase